MTVGELRHWLADKPERMEIWLRTLDVECPVDVVEIDQVMVNFGGDCIKVIVFNSGEGE